MIGLLHIYTGDGKGKTSAALGLSLRAAGRGLRVVIVQFLKGGDTGELKAISLIPGISVLRNSKDYGFFPLQDDAIRELVRQENDRNLRAALAQVQENACDVLILDEACAAYRLNALDRALLDNLIAHKPPQLELIITGRDAPSHFLDAADYISDIRKVKHPYDKGVSARKGIEY